MSDFTVIETQEQLDKIVGDRLKEEREAVKKEYEGYLSPKDVDAKYAGYLSPEDEKEKYKGYLSPEDAAKKDAKIKEYETESVKMRVAHELGLSYAAAGFIKGDDEESIRKSAESLKSLVGHQPAPPLADPEGKLSDDKDEALKQTLRKLKGE